MISFAQFQREGGVPLYRQILRYLKQGVAAGRIVSGDELPSRRVLSALLAVNPNTVQKAYRLLEEEGLLQSHTGAKSYMVLDEEKILRIRRELLEEDVVQIARSLARMGLTKEDALALLDRCWEKEETP